MQIDRVSYCLSYTDCLPGVSIASGIVHLTCFVRDQIFGKPEEFRPNGPEKLGALANRKLDDWSHLTKGILALTFIVGNVILLIEAIWRALWVSTISTFEEVDSGHRLLILPDDNELFPDKLLNDAEFIRAAAPFHFHLITKLISEERKNDVQLMLDLIRTHCLSEYSDMSPELQQQEAIWRAYIEQNVNNFQYLPENLKNDLDVIEAADKIREERHRMHRYDDSYIPMLRSDLYHDIPNKEVLKARDNEMLVEAVRWGNFKLSELDVKYRSDRRYAIAALFSDVNQFDILAPHLQRDITVHEAVLAGIYLGTKKRRYVETIYEKAKIILHNEWKEASAPFQLLLDTHS